MFYVAKYTSLLLQIQKSFLKTGFGAHTVPKNKRTKTFYAHN